MLSELIRGPLPLDTDLTAFSRPFRHHRQLLIGLTSRIIVQAFDLAGVAPHGNIVEAADRQTPARV